MRSIAVVLAAVAVALAGCGQCTAICVNTAVLNVVDSAGNPLTLQSATENVGLSPGPGCGTTLVPNSSPPTLTSSCPTFGVDLVGTDGKRFTGTIDLSDGSAKAPVCGSVCKTKSVTVTLQ